MWLTNVTKKTKAAQSDLLLLRDNNFSNFITRAGLLPAFRYIFGHLQNKKVHSSEVYCSLIM